MSKYTVLTFVLAFAVVAAMGVEYIEEDITAYHFHTYFFVGNQRAEKEAMEFRKELRKKIDDGFLSACSLNAVEVGPIGPHPYSQWEMCCNKTSLPQATAIHMQNRGNLSVLLHPLTRQDLDDHVGRATWIGEPVPLDSETGLFVELPTPRRCPVYPSYPDEIPRHGSIYYEPLPGTESAAYQAAKFGLWENRISRK